MKITYLSHGLNETGGYRHEKHLTETISEEINNCGICYKEIRFRKNYKGIIGWLKLFFNGFFNAKGDIIITVARLAWPVYFKTLFSKTKIILVLHNYDELDGKPGLYYKLLNFFLSKAKTKYKRIKIVVVSKYWQNYLFDKKNIESEVFYNYFENGKYLFFKDIVKKNPKQIHFGQWSEKIDKKAYHLLWHELKQLGFTCYFSSNVKVGRTDLPVEYFQHTEAYLKKMALSKFTVILNKVNEGWNRVAHESLLCGTQVITNDDAGPKELIGIANGYFETEINSIVEIIKSVELKTIDFEALEQFDIKNSKLRIDKIVNWIKHE